MTRLAKNISIPGRHSVMGLWTRGPNLYVASYSEREVKRVAPDGKVRVVVKSGGRWSPVGGAFAPNGDLLLLEVSPTNQVRLRRVAGVD